MSKNGQKRTSFNSIYNSTFFVTRRKTLQISWLLALMFVLVVSSPMSAAAQVDFPHKGTPITIIVPSNPGGTMDITARLVQPILEKELGTPVVVANKPGGHMLVGLTELALSKPDGYTIGTIPLPMGVIVYLNPDTKAIPQVRELQPIATHNVDVVAIGVGSQSPYRTVKDLVEAAKASPGKLK